MKSNTVTILMAVIRFTQLSGFDSNQFSIYVSFSEYKIKANIKDGQE